MFHIPAHKFVNKAAPAADNDALLPAANWQTPVRGTNDQEYQIYLACADDGKGGDITRGGAPLKSYDEWLAS